MSQFLPSTLSNPSPKELLSELFEVYADRLYRLALSLLSDEAQAEDVVQETFLKVITHGSKFEERSSWGTWLYRVTYNACLDRLRKRVEEPLPSEDQEGEDFPMPTVLVAWKTPEQVLLQSEGRREMQEAIHRLPAGLRATFLLRDVEGLSTEETAEALGIEVGAVKVRLHRARLMLRERLALYFTSSGMDQVPAQST
jgi:RNA polymerase sigma-70 factor (ECF subfamily)